MSASVPARSEERIDDVGAHQLPRQDVLIPSWTSAQYRLSSPANAQVPFAVLEHYSPPHPPSTIQSIRNNFTSNSGQDVHYSLNADNRPQNSTTTIYNNGQHLASPVLPSRSPAFHHGSINTSNPRPRTNLPVFDTPYTLAAHYGIPTKLPPIPRVNSNNINSRTLPPVPRFSEVVPSPSSAAIDSDPSNSITNDYLPIDIQSLIAQYTNMVNQSADEVNGASAPAAPSSPAKAPYTLQSSGEEAAQTALFGGMTDFTSPMWNDFLTSPFLDDETPLEDFLNTPAHPSIGDDFSTSPAVVDSGSSAFDLSVGDLPLVSHPDAAAYDAEKNNFAKMPTESTATASGSASPIKPPVPNFENMYTMPPATPALEPSFPQMSPLVADVSMASPNPARTGRKKTPTGTRKNVTPEMLVPLEAPTQARNYIGPSVTSRKPVTAIFARKRARSVAFADDEDELAGSEGGTLDAPANETEAEAIAAKRRQNTLAARRSRKRKLEYQRELEEGLEAERREKETWRERALMLRQQIVAMGFPEPFREA